MTADQTPDVTAGRPQPGVTGVASPWHPAEPNVPNVVPDPPAEPDQQLVTVDVDTLIDRPDLAPGASTLIKAGDTIPAELAHHPRHPATTNKKRS